MNPLEPHEPKGWLCLKGTMKTKIEFTMRGNVTTVMIAMGISCMDSFPVSPQDQSLGQMSITDGGQ